MGQSIPVQFSVPVSGVYFAESVHARDFTMRPRADPFHKLIFVQRGCIELRRHEADGLLVVDGEERSLMVVPAGVRHQIVDVSPSVLMMLGLGRGFVAEDPEIAAVWARLREHPESVRVMEAEFARWWRRAIVEQTMQGRAYQLTVRAMAMQMLVSADRNVTEAITDPTEHRVRLVIRRMGETFFEDWTIERAAERAGLSRRQFTLRFREIAGESFVQHLTGLRLAHAERLLRGRGHSVTGAAMSAGFADLSHFYRVFRQRHGVPPRVWLEREGPPA